MKAEPATLQVGTALPGPDGLNGTAVLPAPVQAGAAAPARTVWGLDPVSLHSRFWASRGIQVVRQGEPSELVKHVELFLLTDARTMAIFRLIAVVEQLAWVDADLMILRLSDHRDRGYRELAITDGADRLVRFKREYGGSDSRLARVALTPDREVARLWQLAPDSRTGWQRLRTAIRRRHRWTMSIRGRVYDRQSDREVAAFVRDLVETWQHPDATIHAIRRIRPGVWAMEGASIDGAARFAGPVWVGAGRRPPVAASGAAATVVGPSVMWDAPGARPVPEEVRWLDLQPTAPPTFARPRRQARVSRALKRGFDIVFALIALALTVPLYPFIALAIVLEDPGPIFFIHKRETMGGKVFGCIKFRSMKRNAEDIKRALAAQNRADGPQFYIPNDPRLTRVGALLRACQLDEIPQFINVLLGHMSVVGPRPSPFEENQYCPPWREARLSVRPGVTGLWQIKRTRAAGADFQEWIRYDIQYVENQSFWLDLYILWKTILVVIRGVLRS
jgi:lipopolysaccharide/colanic/teichoic acid biosynthesis glycosyltransferase